MSSDLLEKCMKFVLVAYYVHDPGMRVANSFLVKCYRSPSNQVPDWRKGLVEIGCWEGQMSNEIARLKFDIPKNDDAIV